MNIHSLTSYQLEDYFRFLNAGGVLVQCFANTVTSNSCANLLLAAGASPVMADDINGAREFSAIANALTINIGTPFPHSPEAMSGALSVAASRCIPVVLDPVGCGSARSHMILAQKLLKQGGISILRCNQSEAKALLGQHSHACGVDILPDDIVTEANLPIHMDEVFQLAKMYHCVAAVTGAIDIIASPIGQIEVIRTGHPIMGKVTGAGCMLSALIGAFAACTPGALFDAAVACVSYYGDVGLRTYHSLNGYEGSGTFPIRLIDIIYHDIQNINDHEKI